MGVLGTLEQPEGEATRAARSALTGAAELLMGRIDAAAAALGATRFDDDPEVALWRCAVASARRDWAQAARELERSEQVLATCPHAFLRLGPAAAASAIEVGDAGLAATLLEQLEGLELVPKQCARLAFLSGEASARGGAVAVADEIWRTPEHDGPLMCPPQALTPGTSSPPGSCRSAIARSGSSMPRASRCSRAGRRGIAISNYRVNLKSPLTSSRTTCAGEIRAWPRASA